MLNKKDDKISLKIKNIRFLSDQPLTADRKKDVRFGHPGMADNLREIILQCPLPFTIGLFGKWGSGKTTIINLLKDKLKDDKVALVKFDIWKHEKDSLRRAFLEELVKQCKSSQLLPSDFKLSQRLKNPIQKVIKGSFEWSKKGKRILLGIIGLIIIIGGILFAINSNYFWTYLSILLGGGLISSLFIWILAQTITRETLTTTIEPFKDPHEFEEEFERIVKNISSERLLIIVDNLDRCTHNKAVELLSTIKTFLAKDTDVIGDNKCIFLIACDDEAIKEHLKSVYLITNAENKEFKRERFRADEFLRKFFNTFLRIPDFIDTELQTYTESLLKDTKIPQFDSSDLDYVITNAFRENPRQIKQFINSLISHFLLARQRENGSEPLISPAGTITENIPFLAKFLIIRQKFPEEFNEIKERNLDVKEFETIGNQEFKDFIKATKTILVSDIRPFIYLKQSEEELAIPGLRELELELIDYKVDKVKERLKTIKEEPKQLESLKRFVQNLIERNKHRKIPLLNITSSLLDSFRYHSLVMPKAFYNKIADLLNDDEALKPELSRFEPSLIFDGILNKCGKEDRNGIVAQYFDILLEQKGEEKERGISEDYAYSLIRELLTHKDWLDKKEKNYLRKIITETYFSSLKILSLFKDKADDQKEFITKDAIGKFVKNFSIHDIESIEDINEKTNLLIIFNQIISPEVAEDIIMTLQNLFENENQKPYRDVKENFLECVENIFDTFISQIADIPDKTHLNTFSDIFIQGMNALGDWNQKKIFIFTSLFLIDILEEPQKSNINVLIENFFSNADVNSIRFVFDKLNLDTKKQLILKYKSVFQPRALQQKPIFDFLYPLASKEIRTEWITGFISSNPRMALAKLAELNYKVEDKKIFVQKLLEIVQQIEIQERGSFYKAINKMSCANDANLRKVFSEQIKSLMKNTDTNYQQIGYSAFQDAKHFSATLRRGITREIIEWLRSLQPENANQIYAIRSVLFNWDIMEFPVKEDYIDFVFDKLIKRGVHINNIQLGFEILFEIKPTYEDYSTYFEDVFSRIESEDNDEIKIELKNGLLKIRPKRIKKKERGFWEKLEKL